MICPRERLSAAGRTLIHYSNLNRSGKSPTHLLSQLGTPFSCEVVEIYSLTEDIAYPRFKSYLVTASSELLLEL